MIDGDLIKTRRKELGLKQKELADGICTQGVISKIERNELNPSEDLLEKISNRLDITKEDLRISKMYFTREEEVSSIKDITLELHRKKKYHSISTMISQNKELISESIEYSNYYRIFFTWLESEMLYHLKGKPENAVKKLIKLEKELELNESVVDTDLKIQILTSLAAMYYIIRENDKSIEVYRKAEKDISNNIDFRTQVRFLYNFSLALTRKEEYKEALANCLKAIDQLKENESLYLLGYLHYEVGYIYSDLEVYDEALEYYNIALSIFKVENVVTMIAMTNLEIKSIKNKEMRNENTA